MTEKEFEELCEKLEIKLSEFNKLRAQYRKETGVNFESERTGVQE